MYSLKKKFAVALSGVLTLAMLAPAVAVPNVAKAADSDVTLNDVGLSKIDTGKMDLVINNEKVFVDTMKGDAVKGDPEIYKGDINLDYLNGKAAKLQVYPNAKKDKVLTLNVEKQPKLKVKFSAEDNSLEIKNGSDDITNHKAVKLSRGKCINGDEKEGQTKDKLYMAKKSVEKLSIKGATVYVTLKSQVLDNSGNELIGYDEEDDGAFDSVESITGSSLTIVPESKQAKFKIAAKPKAPKVTLDMNAVSFKVPKGCMYSISKEGTSTSGSTTEKSEKVIFLSGTSIVFEFPAKKGGFASGSSIVSKEELTTYASILGKTLEVTESSITVPGESGTGEIVIVSSSAATTKAETINIVNLITGAAMSTDRQTDLTEVENGLLIQVWKEAKGKKPASKIRELAVPSQRAVTVSEGGIFKYSPTLDRKKTKQTGISITNSGKETIMIAIVDNVSNIDTTNKKTAKWITIKENKTKTFKAGKVEGKYIVYRYAGVTEKEAKKNKTTAKFASAWICDGTKIEMSEAVKGSLTVSWKDAKNKTSSGGSIVLAASEAAINYTPKAGCSYYYKLVGKDTVKTPLPDLEIGTTLDDVDAKEVPTSPAAIDVEVGKVALVYEVKNGLVIAYGATGAFEGK